MANHFGYALPVNNGLPCRLHYRGRDYDNNEQCAGMNRSTWDIWYAAHHHVSAGGACEHPASLRRQGEWPLHTVAGISTLFGRAHRVLVGSRDDAASGFTTMVLYVEDGGCYRPYVLSGGP
jgi:hypothetical protein